VITARSKGTIYGRASINKAKIIKSADSAVHGRASNGALPFFVTGNVLLETWTIKGHSETF
jgi:hypothetical protein